RVHDVLSIVNYVKNKQPATRKLTVAGLGGAGPWGGAGGGQWGGGIDQAVIDTGGLRFSKGVDLHDPTFLPGGARYGDVPALLALGAPGRTWVAGESQADLALAQTQYQALNAADHLTPFIGETPNIGSAAWAWLMSQSGQ